MKRDPWDIARLVALVTMWVGAALLSAWLILGAARAALVLPPLEDGLPAVSPEYKAPDFPAPELNNASAPDRPPGPRYPLSPAQRDLIERVIMSEAGNQGFVGQALVAQCVLNTCEARGMTPDQVVLERNQYSRPYRYASDSVKSAVAAVFDNGFAVTDEPIRFFYNPKYAGTANHEWRYQYVLTYRDHRFFKAR